jgi:adenine-specific DNA-methyltransferase
MMKAVLERESVRQLEQKRLDGMKTARERNRLGQFATPPELAHDIANYAWRLFKPRREKTRFLDPAIGTGSFFAAFLQTFPASRIENGTGIELDRDLSDTARTLWGSHGLHIIHGDFTRKNPSPLYNLILSNPPYVRHHHLGAEEKKRLAEQVRSITGIRPSGLSGLYCYFLLIAHAWLEENGLAIWLIPSEFMDVNYGKEVKSYLTEKVNLLHVHRFCPSDVQFDDALVSSAIIVFEKKRPSSHHAVQFTFGGSLLKPLRSERVPLDELRTTSKWSFLPQSRAKVRRANPVVLGDLFVVKRGLATGNNSFFILLKSKLAEIGIPLDCTRPILPSPRFLKQEIIEADENGWPILENPLALIDCSLSEEDIARKFPEFWSYLRYGKKQKIHLGYLASRRFPWYSQEKREAAPLLCTYMGRSREKPFRFIWNKSKAVVANVYLLLSPRRSIAPILKSRPPLWEQVFKALQSIHPEEFFKEGRVYGGGLYKMEPSELMQLPVNDLTQILELQREKQLVMF